MGYDVKCVKFANVTVQIEDVKFSHNLDHEIKKKWETKSNELFTIALFYGTNKTQQLLHY